MTVRPAGDEDVAGIQAVERACFPDPWSAESIRHELASSTRVPLVATRDDAVVGWAAALVTGDVADLLRIGVVPTARRSGTARALLAALAEASAARGARRMLLEVAEDNQAARAFYAAGGFVEVHRRRRYYRGGVDALVLAREPA